MYIYTYEYMHMYMYIYIIYNIHTHTHTHAHTYITLSLSPFLYIYYTYINLCLWTKISRLDHRATTSISSIKALVGSFKALFRLYYGSIISTLDRALIEP